eukprot:gene11760-11851_t
MPETLGPKLAASRVLESINSWIHAQGQHDPDLERMSCTFSALILSKRTCHIVHIGDSRAYCLSEGRLTLLTQDHVMGKGDYAHILQRAIGFEDSLRLDFSAIGLRQYDRYLLCSDGVYGSLTDARLQGLLEQQMPPDETAKAIVEAALANGSQDNATAFVLDILDLPAADTTDIAANISALPIGPLPKPGDTIDQFKLGEMISDGHYSRLFRAYETGQSRELVIKFPHPRVASEGSYRLAFVREAWVGARVRSPWIGEIIELPAGRQTCLYSVMPFYPGKTLEQRLREAPRLTLGEAIALTTKLGRAINSLHRSRIIHRDVKPDNVLLLADGGLRLLDLGVARVPELEDFPAEDIPGTPSFMAPELFNGQSGNEKSDQFALAATLYRMLTSAFPYGEIEPFTRPKFTTPTPLSKYRPDLPAWLDIVLGKALDPDPARRYGDIIEFIYELENGATWAKPAVTRGKSLYERNPLLMWKCISAILAIALVVCLARH